MKNNNSKKRSLINLFLSAFKISLISFGGGNAIIPFFEKEFVEKDNSLTEEDLLSIVTIANSLPGPSVVEMGAGIGYFIRGFWGSIFCMMGILMPIPILFVIIYSRLDFLKDNPIFIKVMKAIIPVIMGLLLKHSYEFMAKSKKEVKLYYSIPLVLSITFTLIFYKINSSIPIVIMVLICFLYPLFFKKKKKGNEDI